MNHGMVQMPDFLLWLHLPDGIEQAYWSSTATKRQVRSTDSLAVVVHLVLRLAVHGWALYAGLIASPSNHLIVIYTIASLSQLYWLIKWPDSYCKNRTWINMFSRGLHILAQMALSMARAQTPRTGGQAARLDGLRGSWKAFLSLSAGQAIVQAVGQTNHPLPTKPLVLVILGSAIMCELVMAPQLGAAMDEFQVRGHMRDACRTLHTILCFPWALVDGKAELPHCSPGAEHLVNDFIHNQIAMVLPVVATFMVERSSKAGFLRSLRSRKPAWATELLARLRPVTLPSLLLNTWLCLSLQWMVMTLMHRLLGGGQPL